MSDFSEMLKRLKYDKRMIKWNMRQNLLTEKEYEEHLVQLEDLSHLKGKESGAEKQKEKK